MGEETRGAAEGEDCLYGIPGVVHRELAKSGEAMKAAPKDAGSEFWKMFK